MGFIKPNEVLEGVRHCLGLGDFKNDFERCSTCPYCIPKFEPYEEDTCREELFRQIRAVIIARSARREI